MKIVMLKLSNFQEVIARIDEDKISVEDFLNLNFDKIELDQAMFVAGMAQHEHEGQTYNVPELQPLNIFAEKFETPIVMSVSSILYTHLGNTGLRQYYQQVTAQLTGGIVQPPEKNIILPK